MKTQLIDFEFDIGDIVTLKGIDELCRPEQMQPLIVTVRRVDCDATDYSKLYYVRALDKQCWLMPLVAFHATAYPTGLYLLLEEEIVLFPEEARKLFKMSELELRQKEKTDAS